MQGVSGVCVCGGVLWSTFQEQIKGLCVCVFSVLQDRVCSVSLGADLLVAHGSGVFK